MPKTTKICRVCGNEYEYCHTARRIPGVFRWQDVACSPECGGKYLSQIRASRAKEVIEEPVVETPEEMDEYDEEDEDFFEDDDDFDEGEDSDEEFEV